MCKDLIKYWFDNWKIIINGVGLFVSIIFLVFGLCLFLIGLHSVDHSFNLKNLDMMGYLNNTSWTDWTDCDSNNNCRTQIEWYSLGLKNIERGVEFLVYVIIILSGCTIINLTTNKHDVKHS